MVEGTKIQENYLPALGSSLRAPPLIEKGRRKREMVTSVVIVCSPGSEDVQIKNSKGERGKNRRLQNNVRTVLI